MSNTHNKDSDMNSDISSDVDSEFESVDGLISPDIKKVYQVQHNGTGMYKLNLVGLFKSIPSVEIHKFEHDGYSCYITSNFCELNDSHKNGTCLFDMITMDVIKSDGITFKLRLCVEIENPTLEKENNGNLMIWFQADSIEVPLKTNLVHPGNDKVLYYLITELKNEKIDELLTKI